MTSRERGSEWLLFFRDEELIRCHLCRFPTVYCQCILIHIMHWLRLSQRSAVPDGLLFRASVFEPFGFKK